MANKSTDFVIAKFSYNASDNHELGIQKGERLTLMDDSQHWWVVMNSLGQTGYVPSNFVKRSKQGIFSSLRNTLGRRKNTKGQNLRQSNPSSPIPIETPDNGFGFKHESLESVGIKLNSNHNLTNAGSSSNMPIQNLNQTFADIRLHGDTDRSINPNISQTNQQSNHLSSLSFQPSSHLDQRLINNNCSTLNNWYTKTDFQSPYLQASVYIYI